MARKKEEKEAPVEEAKESEEITEEPLEEAEESEETESVSEEGPQRDMHKIKCSECGKDAEVPFKPIEGRPVYCRDCFMKRRRPRGSFGGGGRSFGGGGGYNRRF